MGRPSHGYYIDGKRIPGCTTIAKQCQDPGGLIHWSWQCGIEGKDYRELRDNAANAGTMAHDAVEAHIRGWDWDWDGPKETVQRAQKAFGAFLEWAEHSNLKPTETEVSLVSKEHRFGGTLDAMLIGGKLSLGDWKSSNRIYPEYLIQLAGYAILWEENRPDEPIEGGFHLIRFDKEYGDFAHYWWSEIDTAKRMFLMQREIYEGKKELKRRTG